MTTQTALTCKHCGATTAKNGKPFAHKGALNLHESVHCPKKQGGATPGCCPTPSVRLLRSASPNEAWAQQQGFKKVCTSCRELM